MDRSHLLERCGGKNAGVACEELGREGHFDKGRWKLCLAFTPQEKGGPAQPQLPSLDSESSWRDRTEGPQ